DIAIRAADRLAPVETDGQRPARALDGAEGEILLAAHEVLVAARPSVGDAAQAARLSRAEADLVVGHVPRAAPGKAVVMAISGEAYALADGESPVVELTLVDRAVGPPEVARAFLNEPPAGRVVDGAQRPFVARWRRGKRIGIRGIGRQCLCGGKD